MKEVYESKEYVRSRTSYILQASFEYCTSVLVADVFLAKLLTEIGMSDATIGIISSLISVSFLFQLAALRFAQCIRNIKKTVILFDTVSQLFFIAIYFVPFLGLSLIQKTVFVCSCLLIAYLLKYMTSTVFFKWANGFVMPSRRGAFSANKEIVSLIVGMILTFAVGNLVDCLEFQGKLKTSFVIIAMIMLALNLCNFCCLIAMKEPSPAAEEQTVKPREIWENTLGNLHFRNLVILTSLWAAAYYLTMGFMGTFKTSDLMLSVGAVQIINIVGNLSRIGLSKWFGKFSDKTSYANGFCLALALFASAYFFNLFATPQNWWCVVVFTILQCISMAGINQNKGNMCYNYVSEKYIVHAMSIQNCVSGVVGFFASMLGSTILGFVQKNGNELFGLKIYGQQLLSGISLGIVCIAIVFTKKVVMTQERFIQ